MIFFGILLGLTAVVAIVGTIVTTARDGYGPAATRSGVQLERPTTYL